MSRLGPPARILLSMPWYSTCSWLYVLPLNTDCTSELTEALTPSRRSPEQTGRGGQSAPKRSACPGLQEAGPQRGLLPDPQPPSSRSQRTPLSLNAHGRPYARLYPPLTLPLTPTPGSALPLTRASFPRGLQFAELGYLILRDDGHVPPEVHVLPLLQLHVNLWAGDQQDIRHPLCTTGKEAELRGEALSCCPSASPGTGAAELAPGCPPPDPPCQRQSGRSGRCRAHASPRPGRHPPH